MRIYIVNNKAVNILNRYTHTCLVQFVKSGKYSSVNKRFIRSFEVIRNSKQINQLKLEL